MKLHCFGGCERDRDVAIPRIDDLKYQVATHESEVKDDSSTDSAKPYLDEFVH